MNSKPIFHIFGVPDGFDILNGTLDITPYFQCYYNGSEENTKFSIHRDGKGNITYAYLKYNLSSYQSRTGSFFGMSLTFSNVYCTDPMKLYRLFDFVYADKVLGSNAEKGLLKKIEVESKIQARYLIPNFGSAKDYIQQEIEFVLQNNITNKFANSFQPISVRFKNDQSHLVAQIPFADANNKKIISLLHTYNRIAISPDWKSEPNEDGLTTPPKPKIRIAPETIQLCEENVKKYQSYLIESLANVKAANINDARQVQAKIESVLKDLQSGTSTDQRLPQLINDYKVLSGQFAELIQKIADEQNRRPTPPPREPGSSTKPPIPWWKKYLPYISSVAVLMIFVVVLSSIFKKEDTIVHTNPPEPLPAPDNNIILARKALHQGAYQDALDKLKKEDNYTQHGLYDSIYNLWITSLLDDPNWNEAWQTAEGIEKKTKFRKDQQAKIQDECQEYFSNQVRNANKSNAKTIKKQIDDLIFDYRDKNEHLTKLEPILNPPKGTGSSGTKDTPSPDNQGKKKFAIKMQLASDVSEKLGDHTKAKRIDNGAEIIVDKYTAIVFCLINADSDVPINDKKYFQSSTVKFGDLSQASGWYIIEKTTAQNKQLIFESTDKSEKITITFR